MPVAPRSRKPSLRVERALQRDGYRLLAGMDEVGRGALAGPVTVGVVAIDVGCSTAPQGVRDSKLLVPAARERLVPRIQRWCLGHGVGHASPAEIDEVGIMVALRMAGERALAQLGVLLIQPTKLDDDLVQEVIDLVLVVALAELGRLETLVDDVFRGQSHGMCLSS